jgi:hypothetical protein
MRIRRPAFGIVLALTAGLVGAAVVNGPAARADTGYAFVRGAHLSPNTPSVDVYLTSFSGARSTTLWLTSVGYGDVSPYRRLKAGLYAVSMRPAGAPASSPVALRWTLNARAGDAFTAAAIGMNKDLHGIVLRDDLASPTPGHARVRVIEAASRASRANVEVVGGPVLADSVAFGSSTPYRTVAAGPLRLRATADATQSVRATSGLDAESGSVYTAVLLDAKGSGGVMLRSLQDSAGAGAMPKGAVPAGGGGTALRPRVASGTPAWIGAIAALAVTGLCAGLLGARRVRRPRAS